MLIKANGLKSNFKYQITNIKYQIPKLRYFKEHNGPKEGPHEN